MREATPEELKSVSDYVKSISYNPIVKELEQIREEIEDIRLSEENVDSSWCAGLKYVNNKIIDKHIAELKENK